MLFTTNIPVRRTARKLKRNTEKCDGGNRSVTPQGNGKLVRNGTPFLRLKKDNDCYDLPHTTVLPKKFGGIISCTTSSMFTVHNKIKQ
jgi:hypothetical protein